MQPLSKTPDAMSAPDHPVSLFAKIVIVAFVYALAGIATLSLSFTEGYAAPFWPGAGLGLAALLIWGRLCWPGILVGSFLVDLWMDTSISVLPMASINATASTLQALVAASLVHTLLKRPESLAKDPDLLKFLLFAGPLSCVIASSVGVFSRYWFGSLPAEELWAEWLIWWAGDTLGVLLFTPVILLLWQDRRTKALQVGAHRIVFPLLITATLLLLGNYALARMEQNRAQLELDRVFEEISDLQFETLPRVIQPLIQLERFFSASIWVWPSEFARYTQFMISAPAMIAVDWAPRVPAEQLAAFERTQLQPLEQTHHVFELGSPLQSLVLAQRSEYFPVLYTEPH
ncbi:hypothetical protein LH51_13810 [Nitrincola sp. A-D6]|uniref:MASE1 domain-containing protein n=1 Tax=Nitrincola sp. A-D6 TaxID=1545442 RepID=UPI00051FEA48|nr:MASE1 domain-containing protein [Nitrincola sp. A-D6]KGK41559.1 hypothetical protein LH51_13810 [Nitrincola sp. A-D6]